ncbi:hypothetical protein [Streptomyces sp. DI166]|uniref:hypothetical protein n=1 Tax=Streptomyces sp. DI166 TaxID=1839783 RepID=UPI00159EF026|nr:hypothetical protein [Streptomyces sp. DI166]
MRDGNWLWGLDGGTRTGTWHPVDVSPGAYLTTRRPELVRAYAKALGDLLHT